MPALPQGSPAPDFDLPTDGGGRISLADLRGHKVVLYFYPKDNTAGCTLEAIDFSAQAAAFEAAGTKVVGISADSVKSHDRFKKKHDLTIPLASDEEKTMLEAYGIWAEKQMYGRTFMGIVRTTYLIDAEGRIARVWEKVKVSGHVEEVLAAARSL
ncbi:peroxiredoxin [Kaistia sp. 32K]|uniref:peroxiredoxin n=1 Tax=Kaistia sp. 32K TaxID=2795690 RepID=UPI001914EDA5|nr:peroxiredoxin [Kaistia sp. 32K]BCP53075.1 peroxiredoxin [Kaistia sp. 32K]